MRASTDAQRLNSLLNNTQPRNGARSASRFDGAVHRAADMGQQVSETHRYTSSNSSKLDLSNEKLDRHTKQLESIKQLQQTTRDEAYSEDAKKIKLLTRRLVEVPAEIVALAKQIHQDYANDSTKKLSNIEHTIKNTETKATIRYQQNIRVHFTQAAVSAEAAATYEPL